MAPTNSEFRSRNGSIRKTRTINVPATARGRTRADWMPAELQSSKGVPGYENLRCVRWLPTRIRTSVSSRWQLRDLSLSTRVGQFDWFTAGMVLPARRLSPAFGQLLPRMMIGAVMDCGPPRAWKGYICSPCRPRRTRHDPRCRRNRRETTGCGQRGRSSPKTWDCL